MHRFEISLVVFLEDLSWFWIVLHSWRRSLILPCIQRLIYREKAMRWSLLWMDEDGFCSRSASITIIDFKAIVIDPGFDKTCDFTYKQEKFFTNFYLIGFCLTEKCLQKLLLQMLPRMCCVVFVLCCTNKIRIFPLQH